VTGRRLRKHLFAPVFAGYIYDVTGSYQFAFLTFILLAVL
jgi:cyanate permease